MPNLSIIIPVYNAKSHLSQCVNSILSQSYKDYELILIDDGSTDHSIDLCDSYAANTEFVHVFHKPNGGVSSARNLGIKKAQGNFLLFIDSDDWLEANSLALLMQQRMADLTFFGSIVHCQNNEYTYYKLDANSYYNFSEVQQGLVNLISNPRHPDYLGFTWNKIFKNSIIKKHNLCFIENLSYREDEIFTLQYAAACNNLITLPNIVYNYRKSTTGLTNKKRNKQDFLLLSHAYQNCATLFTDSKLKKYINLQIAKFLLDVIKRTKDTQTRNAVINELWDHYYSQKIISSELQVKKIYRLLLGIPSSIPIKIYMYCKLFL